MNTRMLAVLGCYCLALGQAMAVNPGMCNYYADTAAEENSRNRSLGCGFGGPRWSDDRIHHTGWCSGVRLESLQSEATARLQQLNGCNHSEGMCEQYMRNAIKANEFNQRLGCGFGGPRYTSTPDGHKSWCIGANQDSVDNETRGRYQDLDRCTTCDHYANEAIRYNQLRTQRGCRLSGPRWSSEREGHFRWCMGANLSSVMHEQNERAREAMDCR